MVHPPRTTFALLALLSTSACFKPGDPPDLGQDGSSSEGATDGLESSTSADEPGDGSTSSTDPADDTGESGDPPPTDEVCNGFDDDDDGMVDEDQPMLSCGVGSCEVTVPSCSEGALQECTPALPGGEVCNDLDDDCNGTADDLQLACSSACGDGMVVCKGDEQACNAPMPALEACNVVDDDCNGSFDEDLEGCRVVIYRAVSPVPQHIYTASMEEAQCCGNWYEGLAFQLYADMHAGLVPLYRCEGAGGYQLLSLDPACEGLPTNLGVLGHLATVEGTAGAVPLFRLSHADGDHLYVTSEIERDQAIDVYGYVDEGTIGYAWPTE
jgi:Repeat of unknown function (DUF5648)